MSWFGGSEDLKGDRKNERRRDVGGVERSAEAHVSGFVTGWFDNKESLDIRRRYNILTCIMCETKAAKSPAAQINSFSSFKRSSPTNLKRKMPRNEI
jgi:hypothetical protein